MAPEEIQALIETGIPGARAEVHGDDGVHFEAVVASEGFRGLSTVKQHQMVYRALGPRMGTDIHALALKTCTPEEWPARTVPR
ncbi:MAG: BolA family protein [Chromatiales bacterium]